MNDDDIANIEASLDVELPDSYKELLKQVDQHYGAAPYPFEMYFLTGPDELIELNQRVWGSTEADWDNVVDPSDYFYIGEDGCGNFYCIDIDDDESPVFFLDHDPLGFDEDAPSIEEFVGKLANPPPSPFD